MKKRLFFFLCCLLPLLFPLTGCGNRCSAQSVLNAVCRNESDLPAGGCYFFSPDVPGQEAPDADGEEGFRRMDSALFSVLFGNGALPAETDGIVEAAFYFSYTTPCEFSVFLCKSGAEAECVAKMCLQRLTALRSHYAKNDSEDAEMTDHGSVTVRGRWVFFCLSENPEASEHAFRRAL